MFAFMKPLRAGALASRSGGRFVGAPSRRRPSPAAGTAATTATQTTSADAQIVVRDVDTGVLRAATARGGAGALRAGRASLRSAGRHIAGGEEPLERRARRPAHRRVHELHGGRQAGRRHARRAVRRGRRDDGQGRQVRAAVDQARHPADGVTFMTKQSTISLLASASRCWRVSTFAAQAATIVDHEPRPPGRRLQRSDAGGAGRRQHRDDARRAALERLPLRRQHLGGGDAEPGARSRSAPAGKRWRARRQRDARQRRRLEHLARLPERRAGDVVSGGARQQAVRA